VVASNYGGDDDPLGMLGVIGPSRMHYGRVIPLVAYLSRLITEKLGA
jgi:heat-inducible transcriptional repressor